MNYDIEDMERIITDNIATHVVKEYMINKNDIDTYYTLGKIINKENRNNDKELQDRATKLSKRLGMNVSVEDLKLSFKFYNYINKGMIKSYNIKWNEYLEFMDLNDLNLINNKISCKVINK